jgi:phosphoserine phosphatase RsbU/P
MSDEFADGRLLLIDDQGERARALIDNFGDCYWQIDVRSEVSDIESVLGPKSPYDCVLCNMDLADVSWSSVRRTMRNFDVQVPVIALADDRSSHSMKTALGLGATDFFVRPQERPGLLLRSVERCIHHRHLQRELKASKEHLESANRKLRHSLRMLEQDQQAGRQVQMALLPSAPLQVDDYWFSHTIYASLYLSGDFTDYFQVGDHEIVFFLADVSGHGSSSAFATVLLKNLFARKRSDFLRRQDASITSPVKMLSLANRELLELEIDKYATMIVGVLNFREHSLRYSVAGHLPQPALLIEDHAEYLEGEGSPVGLMAEVAFQEQTIALPERFLLTLMSDGILELMDKDDLVEKEQELIDRLSGPLVRPANLIERLGLEDVDQNALPDDVAALFISRGLG